MESGEKNKYVRWILDHVIDFAKENWKFVLGVSVIAGATGAGVSQLMAPDCATVQCELMEEIKVTLEQCLDVLVDQP